MRLLALDLLRYGHLTDVALRFPEHAGLHVVLGANEAGKSTALSAIGDALFGIPHRSDFAFLHEGNQLRIGVEVASRDGTRAAFIRRKSRQNTLLDPAENSVPEAALQRFLGGAGRDLFEKGFGLNAASLRDGARSLIEGGGAAGEGLLAGMGLPHLRRALERLEKAADELHGTKHRVRRLPAAVDAWQAAQRNLDQATVKPREWSDALEALEKVKRDLAEIAAEAAALKTEELRLRRARAVRQPLAELDRLRAGLEALADAPSLPPDTEETLIRVAGALDKAAQDAAREEQGAERLQADLAALQHDPAVLAMQEAVDDLADKRGQRGGRGPGSAEGPAGSGVPAGIDRRRRRASRVGSAARGGAGHAAAGTAARERAALDPRPHRIAGEAGNGRGNAAPGRAPPRPRHRDAGRSRRALALRAAAPRHRGGARGGPAG